MGTSPQRIVSSSVASSQLDDLARTLACYPALVGEDGVRHEIPAPFVGLLAEAVETMRRGQNLLVTPEDEDFTTQAAADYLSVSRPYLVGLLEEGKIPSHKVGTHRRVRFSDLYAYRQNRNQERRKALDEVFDAIDRDGLYFAGLDELAGQTG